MKHYGICVKCGELKEVRQHHAFGYKTDITLSYCHSCDFKAHIKAKKEGNCLLSGEESYKLSKNSYNRRNIKIYNLSASIIERNFQLREKLSLNLNTDVITISSMFIRR